MLKNLILSVLFCGVLSSCGLFTKEVEVPVIETRTIEVSRPAPIVPNADQLVLRDINWKIVTPDNADEVFSSMENGDVVLFALTANGYENLSLNISDLRSIIQQYKEIIAVYERSYERN